MLKIRKHKHGTRWVALPKSLDEAINDKRLSKDAKYLIMIMHMMRDFEPRACLSNASVHYFLKHNEKVLESAFGMYEDAIKSGLSNSEIKEAVMKGDRTFFENLKPIDPKG